MMTKLLAVPPPRYKQIQKTLAVAPGNEGLKKECRRMLADALQMKESRGSTYKYVEPLRAFEQSLMDHCYVFRDELSAWFCVLTEPYVKFEPDHPAICALNDMELMVIDLDEWSMHYPERTHAYGIRFSREAFKEFKKEMKKRSERPLVASMA